MPTEVIEIMEQHRIAVQLSADQIRRIPEWQPGQGTPPMSIETAAREVLEWIAGNPSLDGAQVYEIKYKPVHNHEKLHRWYYLVELRMAAGEKRFLAVLPGSGVVPAIEEPDLVQ